jgi:general secretion pathway protein B
MSYILEALKKSDRERKQGKVPTLETMPDPAEPRRRRNRPLWPLVLLGFLALSGVFFGAWLYLREPFPVPTSPTEASLPASPSQETSIPTGDTTAPGALPTGTGNPEPPLDQRQTASGMNRGETTAVIQEPAPPETTPTFEEEIAVPPGDETLEPASSVEANPDEEVEESSPEPTDQGEAAIVKLENLPSELQDELPEIKIDVHLYSENPAARRASINGRLLREGQLVGPGLHLEEITRQGVVLSFRSRKFSVSVFPR